MVKSPEHTVETNKLNKAVNLVLENIGNDPVREQIFILMREIFDHNSVIEALMVAGAYENDPLAQQYFPSIAQEQVLQDDEESRKSFEALSKIQEIILAIKSRRSYDITVLDLYDIEMLTQIFDILEDLMDAGAATIIQGYLVERYKKSLT